MHLDLQSIINYIAIGIVVFFLTVFIVSILTNKIVTKRKKKQEEILERKIRKLNYSSSKVQTFTIPGNYSVPNPTIVSLDQKPKNPERFTIVNEPINRNSKLFSYKSWN